MIERETHSEPTCRFPLPPGPPSPALAPTETPGLRRLRAKTRCTSLDEFVASFSRFVNDSSVFVITAQPLAVGTEREFAFQLADTTVVFQGRGRVIEPLSDDEQTFARIGMRLAIVELTPHSRDVHRLLLAVAKPSASFPHRNTISREPTPDPCPPSLPVPPAGPWEDEPTRPGTPDELAALLPGYEAPSDGADMRDSLPVNPLATVSEDALSSLVEYTLCEENGWPDDAPASLERVRASAPAISDPVAHLLERVATLPPIDAVAEPELASVEPELASGEPELASVDATAPVDVVAPAPWPVAARLATGGVAPAPLPIARLVVARLATRATAVVAAVRRPAALIAATATVAGLVLGYLLWGGSSGVPHQAPAQALAAPPPATVTLELRSDPEGAAFEIDGVAVGTSPIDVPVPAGHAVEISAVLPDHETWTRRIHPAAGRTAVFAELPIVMDATTISPRHARSSR